MDLHVSDQMEPIHVEVDTDLDKKIRAARYMVPARWVGPWVASTPDGSGWHSIPSPHNEEREAADAVRFIKWLGEQLAASDEVTLVIRRRD